MWGYGFVKGRGKKKEKGYISGTPFHVQLVSPSLPIGVFFLAEQKYQREAALQKKR